LGRKIHKRRGRSRRLGGREQDEEGLLGKKKMKSEGRGGKTGKTAALGWLVRKIGMGKMNVFVRVEWFVVRAAT